jgi:SAM-dependent methyltransferase
MSWPPTTITRQFAAPRGLLGRLIGYFMARNNRSFNRWVVGELGAMAEADARRVVELGCGPGVGLEEALPAFPEAKLWGVDPSGEMVAQAHRRNAKAVGDGRLNLMEGDTTSLAGLAPVDLAYAIHVLYFWHEPSTQLVTIRKSLRPGGTLGIGYRLKGDMPRPSQENFPAEGHRLYEADDEVLELVRKAGFTEVELRLQHNADARGRLVVGIA